MRRPRGGGDLDQATPLYLDLYVALDIFHMPYPHYIQQTTPTERVMYQLYLGLKGLREQERHEQMLREQEIERDMAQPQGPPARTY